MDVPTIAVSFPAQPTRLIWNYTPASGSILGQIISRQRPTYDLEPKCTAPTVAAPVNCKHGLREDWCAICLKKESPRQNAALLSEHVWRPLPYANHNPIALTPLCKNAKRVSDARGTKERSISRPLKQRISRCLDCGNPFVDGNGKPTLSRFEFCGETILTTGPCKLAWLARHPSVCEIPKSESRLQQVTPEDVDWAKRQTAVPHSETMPRKAANFCAELGMYVQENWKPRDGSTSSIYAKLVADYVEKSVREWAMDIEFQRTHPKNYCRTQDKASIWLVKLGTISDKSPDNGGKRVSTNGCSGTENDGVAIDRCSKDRRDNKHFNAQQPWKYLSATIGRCLRCGVKFAARKGTKFCLGGNCRKRHHEEQGQANNLPN